MRRKVISKSWSKKKAQTKDQKPRFYLTDGQLTAYALACGYYEHITLSGSVSVTLSKDGCYHIRCNDGETRWETARSLTEARALFHKTWKELCK